MTGGDPASALRGFFSSEIPDQIAVALSGGSDSLALLSLLHAWRENGGPEVSAVTVNHGLRPEAAGEAAEMAQLCEDWNVPHATLDWARESSSGNLHDQARRARYTLMAEWALSQGIGVIALGHTQDDQAETFLMRLARGAGVDGLSAMRDRWDQKGVTFVRPLLACGREALRDYLREKGISWVEDAANRDPIYERSRVRAALPEIGISTQTLSEVAGHLAQARDALHGVTLEVARKIARVEMGDVVIDHAGFSNLSPDLARRLLLTAMRWINGAEYPPRGGALTALYEDVLAKTNATLQGCDVSHSKGAIRLTREAGALRGVKALPGEPWDGRWRVTGPNLLNARIAALGEDALRHCPDRAESPLPARSLIATPAVWQGNKLIAAPLAGLENGWSAELLPRGSLKGVRGFADEIAH
ncbi:MAG: tRNA lysidine(34) synthetase TilS [Pseudomonadota bacterium]